MSTQTPDINDEDRTSDLEPWLVAFRQWSEAPQFPSRQEEQEAEWAFRAGWLVMERKMKAHRETAVAAITGAEKQVDALRAEIEDLTRLSQSYLAECSEERVKAANAESENGRLATALRQILEDPDAKIRDSNRDDGWEALNNGTLDDPH